ncbi:MAG: DnaD domain protein [Oscillospiraceae bacterium]|nr:DnaD domain protein [Oscillospiraceae bacterium]
MYFFNSNLSCENLIKSLKDSHIKLACAIHFKVLFAAVRISLKYFSSEKIASALGLDDEDVKDAMNFWVDSGVICYDKNMLYMCLKESECNGFSKEEVFGPKEEASQKELCKEETANVNEGEFQENKFKGKEVYGYVEKESNGISNLDKREFNEYLNLGKDKFQEEEICGCKKKEPNSNSNSKNWALNFDYVSERIEKSEEIEVLLKEVQNILGRPLSGADVTALVGLKDREGLPSDVILMIVQYCQGIGKCGTRYVEKVGINWAQGGIDSLEKAENKIEELGSLRKFWGKFERIIGSGGRAPTSREKEAILRWFVEWNFCEEMVRNAYERCIEAKGKYIIGYMDTIISRWNNEKIFTPKDLARELQIKKSNPFNHPKNFRERTRNTSYNIENYEKSLIGN